MNTSNNESTPQPKIPRAEERVPDSAAKKEEELFADAELEKAQKKHKKDDLGRIGRFKELIFWLGAGLATLAAAIAAVAMGSLAWHYMLPESHNYLSEDQISNIKNLLLSAATGSLVTSFINQHLKK